MKYNLGNEKKAVQNPLIEYVKDTKKNYFTSEGKNFLFTLGWEYIKASESLGLRGGETGYFYNELLINQLVKLNSGFMDRTLAEEVIKKLKRVHPNIQGNHEIWQWIKGLKTIYVPHEKREYNVTLIDSVNILRNTFHVTDEFSFSNGTHTIRFDIVFLINGIPLLFVETKSATKVEGIKEALRQVKRYHRECPEMLSQFQIYNVTHILKYLYSVTWNLSSKWLFDWKNEIKGEYELLVKSFFDKKRVIKLLTDYILFTEKDEVLQKIVLRPHQIRAVEKCVVRSQDEKKPRGLIWHTQGSGKTYTMIVTAKKLLTNPLFENPTILMLVDRNELETQLFGNLSSAGFEEVKVTTSKRNLRSLLQHDYRGRIVTMIHKFDNMPENINTRKNIFILVDEAHRTTGGKLGNYLTGALPNATMIGFTGTPIDKTSYGKGTFITFGKYDPPKGYIDKYNIAESIEDGTTLPLNYTIAPNQLLVDKVTLNKEFLDLVTAEGMSDIEELNKVLEKAVNLRTIMKKPERIQKIAEFVVEHYKSNVEPLGYKAFLVAVDREACAKYKEELDKLFPSEYSKVVYSSGYNDGELLSKYHLSKTHEKQIRKDFIREETLPKILIVTEKLLTGFDAPILYCIYLDKPMRDHVLLQAIARVNRPYEDKKGRHKPSGFVLDFVGIFDNLEKALAFDSTDISGVINDIKLLKNRFIEMITIAKEKYFSIFKSLSRDKAVDAIFEYFQDEEIRMEYYKFFEEITDIYDILSPDSFLRPYINDMEMLLRIYKIARQWDMDIVDIDDEFSSKTVKLIHKHTYISDSIDMIEEIFTIDENTLKKIEESHLTDKEKVFNLIRSLQNTIEAEKGNIPVLISIGERAEEIIEHYRNRQLSTLQTLENLKNIIIEIQNARKERVQRSYMTDDTFTLYWILKNIPIKDPQNKAIEFYNKTLKHYQHFRSSEKQERVIKQNLFSMFLKSGMKNINEIKKTVDKIIKVFKS